MKPTDKAFFKRPHEEPWPQWLEGFREHQIDAAHEIVEAFDRGAEVVFLDAPTGSGKTLIAEMVRRMLGQRGTYVCNGIELQHQFERDYPYAKVLKGRANYRTELMPAYSCDDCAGPKCGWCSSKQACPYQMAKKDALTAPVAVLNTSYLLAEANSVNAFKKSRQFVIVDECDTLERLLMGYIDFNLGLRRANELRVELPVKAARAQTVHDWFKAELEPAIQKQLLNHGQQELFGLDDVEKIRKQNQLLRLYAGAEQVRATLEGGEWNDWVREYDGDGKLTLKPVRVSQFGEQKLWRHGKKWLCMSASVISVDEQIDSLGLEEREVALVTVPMTFPLANRPIIYRPEANITYATRDEEIPKLVEAIKQMLAEHPGDNVLLHTVSYFLTRAVQDAITGEAGGRPVLAYYNAHERGGVLEDFRSKGGVLVAPSLDRGIDLPDAMARVVGVCKIPFPALKDRQISTRMHQPGGDDWYGVQVARTLVQMTGRGVRHDTDTCRTFIWDKQFGKWWNRHGRRYMPDWWKEAVTSG